MHQPGEYFPGQHPNEQIVVFTRRHWIVMVGSILVVALSVGIYAGLAALLVTFLELDLSGIAGNILTVVSSIVLLMAWLVLYVKFIDYYLDVWILTDERIVQIKQRSLFNREIAEFDLSTVQDVSSQTRGVLGTFLNYGKIFVQTAGARDLFEFRYVPNSNKVEQQILNLQEKLEAKTKAEIGASVRAGQPLNDRQMEQLNRDLPDVQ